MVDWEQIGGNWQEDGNQITQVEPNTPATAHVNTEKFNQPGYILSGSITLLSKLEHNYSDLLGRVVRQKHGEAKLFYSNAKETTDENLTEAYRIDFIDHDGQGKCRLIIASTISKEVPLEVREGREFNFKLTFRTIKLASGKQSLLTLTINDHIVFDKEPVPVDFDGFVGVGTYSAKVTFRNLTLTSLPKKKCFVIMQYDNQRNYLYEKAIKNAIRDVETDLMVEFEQPYRLDENRLTGLIPPQLQSELQTSDICIADISEPNLNVFYEIGFAEALNKIVITMRDRSSKFPVPSDRIAHRYIPYKLPVPQSELDAEITRIRNELADTIKREITQR